MFICLYTHLCHGPGPYLSGLCGGEGGTAKDTKRKYSGTEEAVEDVRKPNSATKPPPNPGMYQNMLLILQCSKHQFVSSLNILDFGPEVKNIYPHGSVSILSCPVTFIKPLI